MHRTFLGYAVIEWVVAAAFLLLVGSFAARLIWASEIQSFEESLFGALGLPGDWKYLLTVPLAAYWFRSVYARERSKAQTAGVPVVRPVVAIAACSILISMLVLLIVVEA